MKPALIGILIVTAVTHAMQNPASDTLSGRDIGLRTLGTGAAKDKVVPRGYALIIGVAKYESPAVSALQFSETDAEAVYRVLISSEGGAFPAENVHRLIGKDATLARIRHELEVWLPAVSQADDRVVVYFAGHGLVHNGRGYLAPWDVNPQRIDTTGYPMQELGNVLANRVKARWKSLFTDACHSGKINAETVNEVVLEQINSASSQFLSFAATIGKEKSFEDASLSTGFGLFSYFLVQGLKGNADNDPCDGVITADELIEYVRTEVRQHARTRGAQQTPHAASDYDPEMVLGVSRSCGAQMSSTTLSGVAVVETGSDEVDIFVDEVLVGRAKRGVPLTIPGLSTGPHIVKGVKKGYKPEMKEIMIAPGQQTPVTLPMRYPRAIKPSAQELGTKGEKLLYTARSTINPINMLPITRSQSQSDLRRAKELFEQALVEDAGYSMAAYNLGVVSQLLAEEEASKSAFRRAIDMDPAFAAARIQYAGVLIEAGDADEAIRQLTEGLRLEPRNDEAQAQLALAYWHKGSWKACREAAEATISLNPKNYMGHLWRADCTRQLAAMEPASRSRDRMYADARESYRTFTNLTNFSTSPVEWAAFHFIGFHLGSRRHADRKDSYDNLRSAGYLGLCLCEQKVGNLLRARQYCNRAVGYTPKDAIAYFVLGNVQRDLFNRTRSCSDVESAHASYAKVVQLNPDLNEARNARNYMEQIDAIKPALRRLGCR